MAALVVLLSLVVTLGIIICWIIVLTKLFPAEGPLKGILGIICGIYALVWGWMNADQFNIRKVVQIWTALIVVNILLRFLLLPMVSSR